MTSVCISQSLSVFDVDTSSFPTMKASFFAFDSLGNQLSNFAKSDFEVRENSIPRVVTKVTCPTPKPPIALSSVLVMDASVSMTWGKQPNLELAKAAAKIWIQGLPLGKSECAITSFNGSSFINQDFTTDRNKLVKAVDSLTGTDGTDYDAAFYTNVTSAVNVAQTGRNKRVIVFLTDGLPNLEPQTQTILNLLKQYQITVYAVTLNLPCPQCLKDISTKSGGQWYEKVNSKDEAEHIYQKILLQSQGGDPCTLEWQSEIYCKDGIINTETKIAHLKLTTINKYKLPDRGYARLEFNPISVNFKNAKPGLKKDTVISVSARNADFKVIDILSSNPTFTISPTSFILRIGKSLDLTVSFIPADSGYVFTKFTIENDVCPTKYYCSGGYSGKKPKVRTLKLIQPNGGEEFVVGMDTVITWDGILPDDKVKLEYSTDNGSIWKKIADSVSGLSYSWRVPKTPSSSCLARVTARADTSSGEATGVILICSQVWMSTNLNVDHYRNGDPIPEEKDPSKWASLTTGAWCYYNNDPANGAIYGKLYNWHALNDPRGLTPWGWHVPTDEEWNLLEICLGGASLAGGKMKDIGTKEGGNGYWRIPNTGATNKSGFTGLPGGYRSDNGSFLNLETGSNWWTSTEENFGFAWSRFLGFNNSDLGRSSYEKENGFYVRCISD